MEKLSMNALQRLSLSEFKDLDKLPVVLVLDNIRSALNIGSIFRSADAFAIEKLLLCGISAQPPHREILKTALGSTESVLWEYHPSTLAIVQQLKEHGYQIHAIEQASKKTWLQDFSPVANAKQAFILGNEVDGVDSQVFEYCDSVIEIPQFGTKHSLNVAVAAGIVLWEVQRKLRDL
jgi:tRNA G18 (ribose-2'-O)-methylase SpoU